MSKTVNARDLRDPRSLPESVRRIAARQSEAETKDILEHASSELDEIQRLFELRYAADMRAIKRWEDATGKTLIWPDHADLVVWLLNRLESARGPTEELRQIHSTLDKVIGDSDITHLEADELREASPIQWAAERLAAIIETIPSTL